MRKFLSLLIILLSVHTAAQAENFVPAEQTSLPNIEINTTNKQEITSPAQQNNIQVKKTPKENTKKPGFNPKSSGLTNYQYDDTNYKYYKFEKYIKDNIEYSKSGSTKIY